jgi:anti-anti-sigma factor
MNLQIHTYYENGNVTLTLDGIITLGSGSVKLREAVKAALGRDAAVIFLNCAGVEYIDSSGVAELVSAHVHAQKSGRKLILQNAGWRLQAILEATRLAAVLNLETSPQPRNAAP